MEHVVPRPNLYRHVVFPDTAGGYGAPLNLAPALQPHPVPPVRESPISGEEASFLRWLFRQGGLDVAHYKTETLHRRLPAALRALRATSVAAARAVLRRSPQLLPVALGMLVIGVTSFFRDENVFAALRDDVLPAMIERGGPLRVWSAGCSDGAELYSVAMLLADAGALDRCELLGTDCRPDAVARAAAGAFEPAAVRCVPARLLAEHLAPDGLAWRVAPALTRAARWRVADALAAPEPGPWDLVLCRNLAIYLHPEANAALWANLTAGLRPGGVLVLGKAERPSLSLNLAPAGPCCYRQPPPAQPQSQGGPC